MRTLAAFIIVLVLAGCATSQQRTITEADGTVMSYDTLYEYSPKSLLLPDWMGLRDELVTRNGQIVQRTECQNPEYDNGRYKQDCKITKPK